MALLHATQLFKGNVTSVNPTLTNLYTVAAGERIILRSVAWRNLNGGAGQTVYVYVDSTLIYTALAGNGGASSGSGEWRPWMVLGPGQVLKCAASTATGFGIVASGSVYTI